MIIFIKDANTSKKELKRLQEYLDETNSGIVIVVRDTDDIKTEGR